MKAIVRHRGFVPGKPPRHRTVKNLAVEFRTAVEITEVDPKEFPLAARLRHSDGGNGAGKAVHWSEGCFYEPVTYTERGRRDGIMRFHLSANSHFAGVRDRIDDESVVAMLDKVDFSTSKMLENWRASHVDMDYFDMFTEAAKGVCANYVAVDGKLFMRCFEPALAVHWNPDWAGRAVRKEPVSADCFARFVDRAVLDARGLVALGRQERSLTVDKASANSHERCFSPKEGERADEFAAEMASLHGVDVKAKSTGRLDVLETACFSDDHDVAEFGRSNKLLLMAADEMLAITERIGAPEALVRRCGALEPHDHRLTSELLSFEAGSGNADDVKAVADAFREAFVDVATDLKRVLRAEFTRLLPPPYWGDPADFPINVASAFSSHAIGGVGMLWGK